MKNLKLSTLYLIAVSVLFLVAGIVLVSLVNSSMRRQALDEAESKARIILDRNLATHTYFTHQLKPSVFDLAGNPKSEVPFDPVWMSSTYAVREIDKYFQDLSAADYYYKECAINARSPENEADAYERDFILEMNQNPDLVRQSSIRTIDKDRYFQVLRKSETMEQTCLPCHSRPELAPEGLVEAYGPLRSFGREAGEVVSAISIRIPLEEAYAEANTFSWKLSALLLLLLATLYGLLIGIHKRLVGTPLTVLRNQVTGITENPNLLGSRVNLPAALELRDLAEQFNSMSKGLKESMDYLEDQVQERTTELQNANQQLEQEIQEKSQAEAALIKERDRLRETLEQVRTLKGLIPICANCKKIRDDQGYWNQLESYLRRHSEAQFSHGICPECEKELYPELEGE